MKANCKLIIIVLVAFSVVVVMGEIFLGVVLHEAVEREKVEKWLINNDNASEVIGTISLLKYVKKGPSVTLLSGHREGVYRFKVNGANYDGYINVLWEKPTREKFT